MENKVRFTFMLSLLMLNISLSAQFRPKEKVETKGAPVAPKPAPISTKPTYVPAKPVVKVAPKPATPSTPKAKIEKEEALPALRAEDDLFLMYRDPSTAFPESKKYTIDVFSENDRYVTTYFIYNEKKAVEKKIVLTYKRSQNSLSYNIVNFLSPVFNRVGTMTINNLLSFEINKNNSSQEYTQLKLIDYSLWLDQDRNFIHIYSLTTTDFSIKNVEDIPQVVRNSQNQEIVLQQKALEEKIKEENELRERIKQQLIDSISKIETARRIIQQHQDSLDKYYFSKIVNASETQNDLLVNKITDLLAEKNLEEEFDYITKYNLTMSMLVDKQGKAIKISFADSNTINRKLINRMVTDYLHAKTFPTQTEKMDGKEYAFSTQYDIKIPIQKKFVTEVWSFVSKTKLINKETKDNIAESSYNDFVKSFKKRPWKGRYSVAQSMLTIGDYKLNTIRQTDLKRAYCLQIAFNFGMLPYATNNTDANFENLKFFIPSFSLIYRWIGVYYGFGYYAGEYTNVNSFKYVTTLPANAQGKLMSKVIYNEGGLLLNIGSCFYLKGGINYNKLTIIYSEQNGFAFYNKTYREQYGFTAALCIYPRFFNLEVGYNHIYRSPYIAAGFNIPIKF